MTRTVFGVKATGLTLQRTKMDLDGFSKLGFLYSSTVNIMHSVFGLVFNASTQSLEIHPTNMYYMKLSARYCARFWRYKYKEAMFSSLREFLH